jgi:RND family efflux transporter MFP subunit
MPRRLLFTMTLLAVAVAATPAQAASATTARLAIPEHVRYTPSLTVTGTLKARQVSPLAMSVPGILTTVTVKRGQEVRAGALLASVDDGVASAARRQGVAAARAQLALAEDALQRVGRLRSEDGASEAQAVQTRVQRDATAAQLAAAEAQLDQARVNLAHHQLVAPFAGVVTRVPDGVGITVAAGTPLVTLVRTRELVLETSLTQGDAAELAPGAKASVSVPATGARTPDATVTVVVPAVDAATNRVPVELSVPNRDGRFLPNAFARAELPRGGRDAWPVPSGALIQHLGRYAVWTTGVDAKARVVAVRVLAEQGEKSLVVPGA